MPTDLTMIDPWPAALEAARSALASALAQDPQRFAVIFSPMMTVEEAYMLAKFFRSGSAKPTLVMGPVPVVGEDDRYPKNFRGEAPTLENTRFTIRAEKCPNRLGVEMILKHFQREVLSYESVIHRAERGELSGAYVVGGYPEGGLDERAQAALCALPCLIVQDILRSRLTDAATVLLAAGSFAEREGTIINHAGLAQLIRAAIRPLGEARADGRIVFELTGRAGVFNSAVIRRELAREIPAFAALASGELGELGTFVIKQPQTVTA